MTLSPRDQEQFIATLLDRLPSDARAELEKLRRLYDLNERDATWALISIMMKQTNSQADLYRHIEKTRTDIEAIKVRIDETLGGISSKADELVILSDKVIEAIRVSDNITKYVTYTDRHRELTMKPPAAASKSILSKAQFLSIGIAAVVISFFLGLLIATFLLLLIR